MRCGVCVGVGCSFLCSLFEAKSFERKKAKNHLAFVDDDDVKFVFSVAIAFAAAFLG